MVEEWNNASPEFKGKIIGKLLGDGCITKQKGRKQRFQFIHTATDFEWSLYCYKMLKTHIPLNPPKHRKIKDDRLKKGISFSYYTQSQTSGLITYLRKEWYPQSTKSIPFEMLYNYFTTESLAWWYMDDGHLKHANGKPQKIILSTESFSNEENQKLINFLYRKYSLKFRVDKQNRIIIYDQYQIHFFFHLVTPYMHISMHRKMINRFKLPIANEGRRTTLYLPKKLHLEKPTKEINTILIGLDEMIKNYKQGMFYKTYFSKIEQLQVDTVSYQIVINQSNLERLNFLTETTGISLSGITELSFLTNKPEKTPLRKTSHSKIVTQ